MPLPGYSYGARAIISSAIGGYTYSQRSCAIQQTVSNYAPGIEELSEYCDTDGYLVLKLKTNHFIFFASLTYIGGGFVSDVPRLLGDYYFGNANAYCGDGTHTCPVPS